jgi:4-hydroxy-tetrahydrodipicolinate synthase
MDIRARLKGSIVALVTPFDREGRIDWEKLEELIEWQIASGTDGIVPCGTTGESATLDHQEHDQVVERTVRIVRRRVPVIAGTGSNSTREAIRLTCAAEKAGADAALLVSPYYNKPTQEGLYRHYRAVAEAADLPIVLYNVPGRTAGSIAADTVVRLAAIPRVAAIKEAEGNLDRVTEILCRCEITVLSGDDSLTLPMLAAGARGVISVAANVIPREMSELCRAHSEGRRDLALELHRRWFPLMKDLFLESNPIPVKTALAMMGRLEGAHLRLPLCEMAEENRRRLCGALVRCGLIPG